MAGKNAKAAEKQYIVTVENNPKFCGKGAGGVQFANGKAEVNSERLAKWFKGHKGYTVEEVKEAEKAAE